MSDADFLELQRRNFERQFGSLLSLGYDDKTLGESNSGGESAGDSGSASSAEENDFAAFDSENLDVSSGSEAESASESDSETAPAEAPVIRLDDSFTPAAASRADRKLARLGRAPTLAELAERQRRIDKVSKKQQQQAAQEDADNLDNDLKLQRLLKESHILAHNREHSGAALTLQTIDYEAPIGNARRRILDQRIRAASALNSATHGLPRTLEKMPMVRRKRLIKEREARVAEYERESREAGIVLSKVKKGELRNIDQGRGATNANDRLGVGKKQARRIRDRGLRINSVGKSTRNGLRISPEEISRANRGRGR